jgi:uncharacterized membrane protein YkoI
MKITKVFLASIFLTAAILAVIGGLATNAFASKSAAPQVTQEDVQALQEREAAYNQLIEQANQQIEKANQDLQSMQSQLTQAQQKTSQPTALSVGLSESEVQDIAAQAAAPGMVALKKPELVDFEGKVSYEVAFEGSSIYIDAQTGEILFNGTLPQEVAQEEAVKIATDFLKNTDIYQVDEITFRGAPLYRVIFKNSTIVYIDKTGQITYILKDSMASQQPQVEDSGGGGGGNSSSSGQSDDNHEDDEHDD